MLVGSPEWFKEKSQSQEMVRVLDETENLRTQFNSKFSPELLNEMDGENLLKNVFGNGDAMVQLLMYDPSYRRFGAAGEYKYLGIVYYSDGDNSWRYKEGNHAQSISKAEAIHKAEDIRDKLLECVSVIKDTDLNVIQGYDELDKKMSHIFFYKYPWVLKYFQMVFPQYFPGMYADFTIDRALKILGLPNHGKTKRILNAGEISLFIRRCDVHNIVFGHIYGNYWGWEENRKPCENAKNNFENRFIPVNTKMAYYTDDDSTYNEKFIEETNMLTEGLEGKEREAIVKVRINQSKFRDRLIQRYHKCCLCLVDSPSLLVASHIKPWSKSNSTEKLDISNGLLLCPNHDKLFDKGYISFDNDGKILISKEINARNRMSLNISDDCRIALNEANQKYMEYHREHLFIDS